MSLSDKKRALIRESSEFHATSPTEAVKLFPNASDDPIASFEPTTVMEAFNRTVEKYPEHNALMFKDEITKQWNEITYKDYKSCVEKMAKVFIKLGLERHGTVAVLAFNCVEWFISELAAIHAGGIITGIYTTNSASACLHILDSSKANILVVDDESQMRKILQIKDKLPHLKAVIQINAPYIRDLKKADGFWRWIELWDMETADVDLDFESRLQDIAANECCSLVYTSGTIGNPKGVMLSHDNILWSAHCGLNSFGKAEMGNESIVSYLPLSHAAAQMLDIFGAILIAGTVYFADRDALTGTLFNTVKDAQPTVFFTVPRLFEKLHEKMLAMGAQSGMLKKSVAAWAKRVTLQHHMDRINGTPTNSIQYRIASKLVLVKVKEALGFQRCRTFLSSAAPLKTETKKYFMSLDMFIYEGYGMSETTVHSLTTMETPSFETVGKCLPGTLTKVINVNAEGHGEICMKGRHVFMGYINEPEKTLEAIDNERWLHSGDLGYIDEDGYIYVTGRIKELIITAGGENIPYLNIENQIKNECVAISNAFVVGDERKFLTLLVTMKMELNEDSAPGDDLAPETVAWLQNFGVESTKASDVIADTRILQAMQNCIDRVNQNAMSKAQKIQKFAILPHDFTIASGELTPTMKLKRNVVLQRYNNVIEAFYT